MLKRALRLWNTVRYLRPVQIYARIWFRCYRPRPAVGKYPDLRFTSGSWPLAPLREPSLVAADRIRLLNVESNLTAASWNDPRLSDLWLYNLHYFDDLDAPNVGREHWQLQLMQRWVEENPPVQGIGWQPYPGSLRIVNWIRWALRGNKLPQSCVDSLVLQVRHLRQRIEWHLLGNHLFSNAKALVFAGCFFGGPEGEGWLALGTQILRNQLSEQVLSDGGQFERSTMYHALAFADLLDLLALARVFPELLPPADCESWVRAATRMRSWLMVMCHPDGEIGFFNDAAIGVAPAPARLHEAAGQLGIPANPIGTPLAQLPASGYVRVSAGPMVALLDVAPVGPDYLPGHAHADTLSFEMSIGPQRIIVNGGTSCYGNSPERLRQRGTAAHSTVIVNGEDSSEVWSGFRVARRARPTGLQVLANGARVEISAGHDGYRRLAGKPQVRRSWVFADEGLLVTDLISGRFASAESRYHLHPDVSGVIDADCATAHLTWSSGRLRCTASGGQLRIEPGSWHPQFGQVMSSLVLCIGFSGTEVRCRFDWSSR